MCVHVHLQFANLQECGLADAGNIQSGGFKGSRTDPMRSNFVHFPGENSCMAHFQRIFTRAPTDGVVNATLCIAAVSLLLVDTRQSLAEAEFGREKL
jgi:hypothetical protein